MKRKFVKVMFFGALALSTVTYVGCKDYDDDIDNLQTQIDACLLYTSLWHAFRNVFNGSPAEQAGDN